MKKRNLSRNKLTSRRRKKSFDFGKLENRKLMASLSGGSSSGPIEDFGPDEIVEVSPQEDTGGVDGGIQRIVNGEQTDEFPAVGEVGPLGCTGTLISPTHVLTAAHCFNTGDSGPASFTVNGQTYRGTYTNHPEYVDANFDAGNDLSVIELDRPVNGVTPMQIHRQSPVVGTMLTLVGFGEGGTSQGGFDPNDTGKQVGQTRLDEVTAEHIAWNFDSHNEANTAPGDSGGPAFTQVNGRFEIIGVTSGGTGNAQTLGDYSFDTRIDIHADWIDAQVGDTSGGGDDGDDGDNGDTSGDDNDDGSGTGDNGDDGGDTDNGQDDHGDTPDGDATRIVVGGNNAGSDTGSLEVEGDRDAFWFFIREDGQTEISVQGTGADSDLDTYLRIYDAQGNLIAENDDFGGELSSSTTVDTNRGRYYAVVGSYDDAYTGDFQLDVKHSADADTDPGDGDNDSDDGGYQTFENNQSQDISEFGRDRIVSFINVSGVQGNVTDINVEVDIDHTWTSDLRLILVSPNGQRIVLANRLGDDGQDFDQTMFDAQADQSIRNADAPFRGTFKAQHDLNRLNGTSANGRWKLVVRDFADGDGGSLNNWKLDIASEGSRNSRSIAANRVGSDEVTRNNSVRAQAETVSRRNLALAGHVEADQAVTDSENRRDESFATRQSARESMLDSVFGDRLFDFA